MNLKLTFDTDIYPTEECLQSIEDEVVTSKEEAIKMLRALKNIWAYANWGWKETSKEFHISTAGWSGNESIMSSLHANKTFWKFFQEDYKAGGHYTIKLKEDGEHL